MAGNKVPRVTPNLRGTLLSKDSIEDSVVHVCWADGQFVSKDESDEYDAPTRWPILNSPLVTPQMTRFFGLRVNPPGPTADPIVEADYYYYRAFTYETSSPPSQEYNIKSAVFGPPDRTDVADEYLSTLGNVEIYATGIYIQNTFNEQVPDQPNFFINRFLGDGIEDPPLTPDDIADPQPWIEARILENLSVGIIDPDTLELDPDLPSPDHQDYDINMDFVATELGATVRSQLGLEVVQYRIRPKTWFNSGDKNVKFANALCPRIEDTAEEFGFYGTDVLNIMVFYFVNYGDEIYNRAYDTVNIADDPFVQGLRDRFEQFKGNRTVIFLDEGIAFEAEAVYADPEQPHELTDFNEEYLIAACAALSDLNFEYAGRIDYRDPESVQQITDTVINHWELEL